MNLPPVLLGITTRNRATILPKAIESALAQDYPNLHVVVVDDASTDATPALAARYPGVEWVRHGQMRGYRANRHDLMQRAEFAYFVSLDDDAWFLQRDEISVAIRQLEADRTLAGVAFDILSPDRAQETPRTAPRTVAMFIGCGHVLRLSSVRQVGGYAEVPGPYGTEEKDISLRLADHGQRIDLLPGVHVWHDKAWSDRDWFPLHRSGVCNELFMTVSRCPWPDLAMVLPLKIASFARYWLRRPQYFAAGVAGLSDFVRALPRAEATRQPVRRETFWRVKRLGS